MAEEIKLILTLEEQKFIRDSNKALKAVQKNTKAFKGLGGAAVTLNAAFQLASSAFRVFTRVAGAFSRQLISTITVASDFQEEMQKFGVVFSGVSDESRKLRDNLAENFGVSRLEATKLLAATGDLLTGFGFTQESALDLSNQVQQLAVDLASFTNFSGGAEGASQALTKALLGERESVKSLGISILEKDVLEKVAINTAKGLEFATLRQAKAYATLQIAQEQSKNAIGDFARSSGSLANQIRILQANITDTQTIIGSAFIPGISTLTIELNKTITAFNKVGLANENAFAIETTQRIADLVEGIAFVAKGFLFAAKVLTFFKTALVSVGFVAVTAFEAVGLIISGVVTSILEAVKFFVSEAQIFIGEFIEGLGSIAAIFDEDIAKSIDNVSKKVTKFGNDIKSLEFTPTFVDNVKEFGKNFEANVETVKGVTQEFVTLEKGIIRIDQTSRKLTNALQRTKEELSKPLQTVDPDSPDSPDFVGPVFDEKLQKQVADRQKEAVLALKEFSLQSKREEIELEAQLRREGAALQIEDQQTLNATLIEIEQQKNLDLMAIQDEQDEDRIARRETRTEEEIEEAERRKQALEDFNKQVSGNLTKSFDTLGSSISSVFGDAIFGTKKLSEGFKELGKSILQSFVTSLIQVGVQFLINAALGAVGAKALVVAASGVAFANAFAATALIPIVGPLLAPAVATGAKVATLAGGLAPFQTGSDFVRETQGALVHRGERIVPTQTNADLTAFLREERGGERAEGPMEITINIDTFLGEEEFVDDLTTRIQDSIRDRNTEFAV